MDSKVEDSAAISSIQEKSSAKRNSKSLFFHILMTTTILLTYIPVKLFLPLYNKILFNGLGSPFHFPISCSCVQILFVSVLLFLCNNLVKIVRRDCCKFDFKNTFKMILIMTPVALCLSLTFVLTNIGIDKVNVNIHVLLKTTKILWVVVFSFFISEKVGVLDFIIVIFIASGGVLISLDVSLGWSTKGKGNIIGVIINLMSPFFDALILILLKKVIQYLKQRTRVIELTFYQMTIGLLFMIIPALVVETFLTQPNFWKTWGNDFSLFTSLLFMGGCITMLFHLSQVALTVYETVLTQTIIGQWIILPQLIIFTILSNYVVPGEWNLSTFKMTVVHIIGGVLIVIGSLLSGMNNFWVKLKENNFVKSKKTKEKGDKKNKDDVIGINTSTVI